MGNKEPHSHFIESEFEYHENSLTNPTHTSKTVIKSSSTQSHVAVKTKLHI